eukprot:4977997-Karenia_brevis.AAC.1
MPARRSRTSTAASGMAESAMVTRDAAHAETRRNRQRPRDIPQQATRAIERVLTPEEIEYVSTQEVDGKCFQVHVEEEIMAQGPNFRLTAQFWAKLFGLFNLNNNPVSRLEKP